MSKTRVEIHYVISNIQTDESDFEAILATMGEYEDTLHRREDATVELMQVDNSVLMALSKAVGELRYEHEALHHAEVMRAKLESHFNQAEKSHLSQRFAGVKPPEGLEVE